MPNTSSSTQPRKTKTSKTTTKRAAPAEREFDFKRTTGRGKAGMRKAMELVRANRGRPRKGETVTPTRARSIRLPDEVWAEISREAKRLGVTDATLVRAAVAHWLKS